MQNRYAADVGDFVKLSILRRLSFGYKLGVLWWLYPDEGHNDDGKHITYLDRPKEWRAFDPKLYDSLRNIVERGDRNVRALESAQLIEGAIYFNDLIPTSGTARDRRPARLEWFGRAMEAVSECDVVFLDPDNGLETKAFDAGRSKAGKSVAIAELQSLKREGRSLIVYHHHTRMAGGNLVELAYWGSRLAERGFRVDALRAATGTARAFFLLDGTEKMLQTAQHLARDWSGKLTWHPALG